MSSGNEGIEPLPKRKHVRLKGYDYSRNGCYFITVCTKDQKPLLSRPTLSALVGVCKSLTTRLANQSDGTPGRVIFQTSFHDHVVRNDADYDAHWVYIDGNPARWVEDEYDTESNTI